MVVCCVFTQMNYLNKALDLFNTAIVSPVYYVMFTTLTILASIIMFRVRGFGVANTLRLFYFGLFGGTSRLRRLIEF